MKCKSMSKARNRGGYCGYLVVIIIIIICFMAKVCRPLFPCSLVYLLIRPGLSGGPAPAIAAKQEADTLGVTFSTA